MLDSLTPLSRPSEAGWKINQLAALVLLFFAAESRLSAGSFGILYYKNNYSEAVDCWVNGQYQGVIPPKTTKYMPVEGFVTADSGWKSDGSLYQKHAYGGWSPSSPAEVVTVTIPRIGQPLIRWTGKFTAQGPGAGYNLKVHNAGGSAVDATDIEFAQGMPLGTPKSLDAVVAGKTFAPKKDLDGGSAEGVSMVAMKEGEPQPAKVATKIKSGKWVRYNSLDQPTDTFEFFPDGRYNYINGVSGTWPGYWTQEGDVLKTTMGQPDNPSNILPGYSFKISGREITWLTKSSSDVCKCMRVEFKD